VRRASSVTLFFLLALAGAGADAADHRALPELTLQDQEGRTLNFSALRGRVVIIIYGGRAGVEEHAAWGKRLDAELRGRGVYRPEDPETARPVRILAVAQMGGIPDPFRGVVRAAVRPGVEKGYSLWLDWDDRMTRSFGAHEPHSTVLVADRDGTVHLVAGGPPVGTGLQGVLDLLGRLLS
jgi:hypothetical protein